MPYGVLNIYGNDIYYWISTTGYILLVVKAYRKANTRFFIFSKDLINILNKHYNVIEKRRLELRKHKLNV